MSAVYFISGPCGCGKTTLAAAYARYLVRETDARQVYLIHGDDFHAGFIESDESNAGAEKSGARLSWEEMLPVIWDCLLCVADKALAQGLDVVIDYIAETELPLVKNLARKHSARLYYVVLTASEDSIRRRIIGRGDTYLLERALFLKKELDTAADNQGHLFDNTGLTVEDEIKALNMQKYLLE